MLRVGLTGGLATGKSFVGEALEKLGCHLIRADELGHQVLLPDGEAYEGVVREFGEGILETDGTISRHRLAAEVFNDLEGLERLSRLVHPPVIRREEKLAKEFFERDPGGIVVTEAAILIETGHYRQYERIVLAVCDREQQIERAMRRNGSSRQEVLARLERQMPLEEKRKFADYVIDTSGSQANTLEQVEQVYLALRSIQS
jgi:dephospho-CoA kinase